MFAGAAALGQRLGGFRLGIWEANRTSLAAADSFNAETAEPRELYLKARAYLDRFDREGNPESAIELLERAVEKDSTFALGYATLTEAYRYRLKLSPDKQWMRLMEQSAARALKLNNDLAAAHIAMGLASMDESSRAKESEAHLRKAVELDPKNAAAHKWLGVLLASKREFARAAESLGRAVELDPKSWAALLDLGLVHYGTANYAQAIVAWERARELSPDNLRVLPNLAAAYHMLDRYDDAASVLQRAIEIKGSAQNWANLGTLRFFQGRYADAIPALEKARDLAPNRYRYWGNLADAYRWSPGDKSKALDAYAHAIRLLREQLELKPQDADMRSTLALYLAKSGDKQASLQELSQLDALKPREADVLFRMAVAYELCGMRSSALGMLEKSLSAGYAQKEIRNEPELLDLRDDVRYHEIMAVPPAKRPV